jgi:hypothetical protein
VHLRFTEMASTSEAFDEAAAVLIQGARAKDPRVGAWWPLDAGEAGTHATPEHDCTAYHVCPTAKATRRLLATIPVE